MVGHQCGVKGVMNALDIVLRLDFRKLWSAHLDHQHDHTPDYQRHSSMSAQRDGRLKGSCALGYLSQGPTLTRRVLSHFVH
jgi:hypothetical protein